MGRPGPHKRKFRGVVEEVSKRSVMERYRTDFQDPSWSRWRLILDHPLTVGQTYEVEVTVREVG